MDKKIFYVTERHNYKIQKIEAERETEKCVFVIGRRGASERYNKISEYRILHESFAAAKKYLCDKIESKIKCAKLTISNCEKNKQDLLCHPVDIELSNDSFF